MGNFITLAIKRHMRAFGVWYCVVCALVIMFPCLAFATDMGTVMCSAADLVTGQISAGLATIGIAALGIGASFGKVSWPAAITVTAGVAGLFAAASIAQTFGTIAPCN